MSKNPTLLSVLALTTGLTLSSVTVPAAANEPPPPMIDSEALDEAAKRMVEAFELILRAIPQYEMPEVLPNGDILIRRVPKGQERHSPPPRPDQDRT